MALESRLFIYQRLKPVPHPENLIDIKISFMELQHQIFPLIMSLVMKMMMNVLEYRKLKLEKLHNEIVTIVY